MLCTVGRVPDVCFSQGVTTVFMNQIASKYISCIQYACVSALNDLNRPQSCQLFPGPLYQSISLHRGRPKTCWNTLDILYPSDLCTLGTSRRTWIGPHRHAWHTAKHSRHLASATRLEIKPSLHQEVRD